MTRYDDTPAPDTPDADHDDRIGADRTVGSEQPAGAARDEGGLQERFEQEAAEGVDHADQDTASLEQEAAALREESARLDRQVPGPDGAS